MELKPIATLTPKERAMKASEEITVILQKYNVQMFVNQDVKIRPLVAPEVDKSEQV